MSGAGHAAPQPAPKRQPRSQAHAELNVVPRGGRLLGVGMVAVTVFAVFVLFGLVAFNALIVDNQSYIDDLDARLDEITQTNHRLRFDIAELESPERIREVAVTQLGMIEPESIEYLEPISRSQLAARGGTDSEGER